MAPGRMRGDGPPGSDPADEPPSSAAARGRLLDAQRALLVAAADLRELLDQTFHEVDAGCRHIEQGGLASDLPTVAGTPTVNPALTESLARFEEARQAARLEIFTLAWAEGFSFEKIAGSWGISRQRVSQIMNAAGRPSVKRKRSS